MFCWPVTSFPRSESEPSAQNFRPTAELVTSEHLHPLGGVHRFHWRNPQPRFDCHFFKGLPQVLLQKVKKRNILLIFKSEMSEDGGRMGVVREFEVSSSLRSSRWTSYLVIRHASWQVSDELSSLVENVTLTFKPLPLGFAMSMGFVN